MPTLAERRVDIPSSPGTSWPRPRAHPGLHPRPVADDAMAVLQTAEWPGDVRQLRNTIEWMLIMAPGEPRHACRAPTACRPS